MYLQDLASIKEQMPDTIEPFSFVNFAKRHKLSVLIREIFQYHQQGFCLKPVASIQKYLGSLDIYELSELKALASQYQDVDGDKAITVDVIEEMLKGEPQPTAVPVKAVDQRSSVRIPPIVVPTANGVGGGNSPRASQNISAQPPQQTPAKISPKPSVSNNDTGISLLEKFTQIDTARMKPMMIGLLQDDLNFRNEIRTLLSTLGTGNKSTVDSAISKDFPGAKATAWNANDNVSTIIFS